MPSPRISPTLAHIPGMQSATPVPELRAETLSESVFRESHVEKSRPCVVKGAVRHWPATGKWRDKHYLKSRAGHHDVFYYPHENFVSLKRQEEGESVIRLSEALERLHDEKNAIGFSGTNLAVELKDDTAPFPFLGEQKPAYFYPYIRYFIYRNAGTTWHYHPFDETLMCQVVGAKRVGLLSLDNPHHTAVRNIFFQEDYYDDPACFAALQDADLPWMVAELEEGDALYIPPLWWHGVATVSHGFGLTAAVPWRSPPSVVADNIRRMAAGRADIVGKATALNLPELIALAREQGLAKELALAWQRGN